MATVLIVDDEFGIAELLDAVLSDDGHNVVTAANGRQGLARVAAGRPDLIFLDFMMPVMDGPAMLAALTADPETRGIPVVLMSSMPEDTVRERAAGHVAFLRKPFRLRQVHDLVARLLAGRPNDR